MKRVVTEYYVNFNNNKLYFDFYVPELGTFFECQGQQHFKFVKFFHGDVGNFKAQKARDNDKLAYIQLENKFLVYVNHWEDVTTELILSRIEEAMDSPLHCAGR